MPARIRGPVIISRKTVGGKCTSSIGAYIVTNNEGWIVTAFHIVKMVADLAAEAQAVKTLIAQRAEIDNDPNVSRNSKNKALGKLQKPRQDATEEMSIWWGADGITIEGQWTGIEGVDIACAKITSFDPAWVPIYPVFKNPAKGILLGVSLARLGYPFQTFTSTWNVAERKFNIPISGSPPVFLNEGILSRMIELQFPGQPPSAFPLCWIETSNPGLKGQSGGPIFDTNGVIWGIQSNTFPYPTGFDPDDPNAKGKKLHQFLNAGRGVHPLTLVEFMKAQGIKHSLTKD